MMRSSRFFVWLSVALFATVLSPTALRAQEWTRFRGPNGTGISTDTSIPVKWTEDDFAWRVPVPGQGHSQPVVWGDKIFLTTSLKDGERLLLCHSAKSGKELWRESHEMTTHGKHRLNSFASSTPTIDKDRVYYAFATPRAFVLAAVDHSGNEVWKRDLGPFSSRHGFANSPILFEDFVVIQNDQNTSSFVVAVDRKSGETRWKTDRRSGQTAFSTPCIWEKQGAPPQLLFNSNSHGISSLDAKSGQLLFEAPLYELRACSSPVYSDNDVVFGTCGSGGGGNFLIAVKMHGKGDVSKSHLAYKLTNSIPYVPTPIVKDGRLYLWSDKGVASCYSAKTGERLWRERVGGEYYSSPLCIGDRIYNASREGELIVLATGDEYTELARNPIGEGTHSTPAVSDGRLIIRTYGHLLAIEGKKAAASRAPSGGQ